MNYSKKVAIMFDELGIDDLRYLGENWYEAIPKWRRQRIGSHPLILMGGSPYPNKKRLLLFFIAVQCQEL